MSNRQIKEVFKITDNDFTKIPIPQSTVENLVNPATKSTGNALQTVVDAFFHFSLDGLRRYNIVKEKDLLDFQKKIYEKTESIPEENRDDSKVGLAFKSLEDSRYQLDEELMRELFSNLLVSTLDDRKNNKVLPSFSHILSNLTNADALFLKKINDSHGAMPLVQVTLHEVNGYRSLPILKNTVLSVEGFDTNSRTVLDTLEMFGLLEIDQELSLGSDYHEAMYTSFENTEFISNLRNMPPREVGGIMFQEPIIQKGRVDLTNLGRDFVNIVFQK
ncbi:DUF4393 domain-containing protein [Enterococcus thailandicus]|uniref:DUF4393 domain-containing protein n=1 Tax=Enterococcus thailandicus TaxID=417368 RepID=UPI002891AE3A|nr:DUF4393 domain-containing protein [Enterococcus thailandicus]MDT2845521.1 DUF4393 domain-containing protein [Enterococcus thailandicus]